MATVTQEPVYHAVCRDCRAERVFDVRDAADDFADRHVYQTDHTVAVGRVA